jgi:hypothetical protein
VQCACENKADVECEFDGRVLLSIKVGSGKCAFGDYIIDYVLHSPMPVVELLLAGLSPLA